MVKQTKLIKFMIVLLMIIPFILLLTGIIQTFVIKDQQNKLLLAQQELNLKEKELSDADSQHKYIYKDKNTTNGELVLTDEYKKELYKHNEYEYTDENGEKKYQHYGDKNNINIEVK